MNALAASRSLSGSKDAIAAPVPDVPDVPDAPAIVIEDVVRTYAGARGATFNALDHVSLSIPAGALCGLIGPNGAGKTTLLSILATLDEEFAGRVVVGGVDVRADPQRARRQIGFVPDHAPLYEGLDVRQFLTFFAHAAGLSPAERRSAVDDAIAFCGLEHLIDKPASALSKGLTQRLCVARALLHRPRVLLLDEPASGLDPRARIDLKELLKRLAKQGVTVLVSSHILTELGDFCDHVVVLEKGRVKAADRIDALFSEALHARPGEAPPRHVIFEILADAHGGAIDAMARAKDVAATVVGVHEVVVEGALLRVQLPATARDTARLLRALVEAGVEVASVVPEKRNLEALFLTVTKGEVQ